MDVVIGVMIRAVHRHGGAVDKVIGDSVMAVYGLEDLGDDGARGEGAGTYGDHVDPGAPGPGLVQCHRQRLPRQADQRLLLRHGHGLLARLILGAFKRITEIDRMRHGICGFVPCRRISPPANAVRLAQCPRQIIPAVKPRRELYLAALGQFETEAPAPDPVYRIIGTR